MHPLSSQTIARIQWPMLLVQDMAQQHSAAALQPFELIPVQKWRVAKSTQQSAQQPPQVPDSSCH